ncbi:MAG TPA: ATP-binding cassette domain-containing protein [Thermoanaerobaculia bacterium]
MLDVSLRNVTCGILRDVTVTFPRSAHSAIVGPAGAGASTLLKLISGELRPDSGAVLLGARDVTKLKAARRPVLADDDVSPRWSVQHALVAAVRQRSLDREDRHHEYALAVTKWKLAALLERRVSTLSSTERTLLRLARMELLRPAIVVADRLLQGVNPSMLAELADELYRTLRVMGATVISAPASILELAMTDRIVVLDGGRVVQSGGAGEVYASPSGEAAARATGGVNVIPVQIRGKVVESVIGAWEVEEPPFSGNGVALVRPDDFAIARPGEESDLVFGVEEAGFADGRWLATGILSGGILLRVVLPREANLHKGRLVALRYDPSRFRLLPREGELPQSGVPTDVIPLLRDSR